MNTRIIEIDHKSGFCFGVTHAIRKAEQYLAQNPALYCLGDIVHNEMEVQRLAAKGLNVIDRETFFTLKNCTVLLRAHGEPPATYQYARENNITLIDGTCPVVLKLQERIRKASETMPRENKQLVIFGKEGHAEVDGLNGQTGNTAIIVQNENDLTKIDPERAVTLFSQTTMAVSDFRELAQKISQTNRAGELTVHDTICRQVSNREPHLRVFAARFDVVIFVGGAKSSNAKVLFHACLEVNPQTHFVSSPEELKNEWFNDAKTIGICGATSTPQWLMEKIAQAVREV